MIRPAVVREHGQRWSSIRSAPKSEGLATLNNILIGYNLGKAKAYPLLYKLSHPRPKQITTNLPQVVCSPEQSSCVPGDRSIHLAEHHGFRRRGPQHRRHHWQCHLLWTLPLTCVSPFLLLSAMYSWIELSPDIRDTYAVNQVLKVRSGHKKHMGFNN